MTSSAVVLEICVVSLGPESQTVALTVNIYRWEQRKHYLITNVINVNILYTHSYQK